jgi:DNA-binding NarL/FixJ family response regulator
MNKDTPMPSPVALRHRIFILDDHSLVREGLTKLIEQEPDLCVCAEATDATEALESIRRSAPDAVVLDISLPGESGLELIKRIQTLENPPPVLVLSMHDEAFYAKRALRAGALGYVMKRESSGKVIGGLRAILAGQIYVSPAIAAQAAENFLRQQPVNSGSPVDCLTDREIEVFRRIGLGHETRRIADDFNLSLKTVQTHCAHIKEKLGIENATVLMREAVRWVESNP